MMTRSRGLVVLTAIVAMAAVPRAGAGDVVALIDGEPLTSSQLEEVAGPRLFQVRTQQYQAQRQILEEEIARRLLAKEAQSRHLSVDDLLKQEVDAKVAPVPETELKTFYEANKARFGTLAEADALKRIETGMRQQRLGERRNELVASLRARAGVRVLLEPPRLRVEAGDNPSRGPVDAPVTIIEFSDFQCPFCSRATGTVKKLEEAYPGKIRFVYRDFPLVQIHPRAARAAEAAACANDQGKFWAMHDALFSHQDKLEDADLKQRAADLGLDAALFGACLDSGRHTAEVKKDQSEGERYGVASTPAFFVNGRLIVGAQPYETFARVVEEELARSGPTEKGKDAAHPTSPPSTP